MNAIAVSLFVTFIHLKSSFLFEHEKKVIFTYIILLHVSGIAENILKTISFARYHLPPASNSTFITDSQYLCKIQIWLNLNEHCYSSTSSKSMICQIDANCSPF